MNNPTQLNIPTEVVRLLVADEALAKELLQDFAALLVECATEARRLSTVQAKRTELEDLFRYCHFLPSIYARRILG